MMLKDNTRTSKVGCIGIPHLHGHTKVTLTDAKTGETEVYEKDNMVTDAVENLYSKNLYGVMDYRDLKPVRDLFGGVMCFDAELDTDSITPERTARVVACAGQVAHSSASTKRGNPNNGSGGSQELSNGYKFVWDFATNQANGTINSLSLCHKNCGDVSVSPDVYVPDIPLIKFSTNQFLYSARGGNQSIIPHSQRPLDLFYLHPSGDWGFHSSGTTITKVSTQAIEQKINGVLGESEFKESKEFTIPNFTAYRDSVTYDVENDKILFITFPTDASVVVYSVDFDEETIETTTFDQGISIYRESTIPTAVNVSTREIMSCNKYIKSGKYIYVPKSLRTFYRLNMTNTSDIVELTTNLTSDLNLLRLGQVNINEGVVLGFNYIIANDTVSEIASPTYDTMMTGSLRSYEALRIARSESEDVANYAWCGSQTGGTDSNIGTFYIGIALILPYLATIQQDFQNPIIKTSEKTMKIEYTITNNS